MEFTLDDMQKADWAQVRSIYAAGLSTGLAAFKTAPPKWNDWNSGQLKIGRIVARSSKNSILGWAALAPAPDT